MLTSGNKNKIKTLFLYVIIGLIAFGTSNRLNSAYADTATDLETQKQQKQQQLDAINKQIDNLNQQLQQTRQKSASLKNEIALYNIQIQSTELHIQATQTNIENTNIQIQQTQIQISQRTAQIESEKKVLADLINSLNQYQNSSGLELGLGSNNFSDLLDQIQYTSSVQDKVFTLVQQVKDLKAKLEKDQQDLQTNLDNLNQLQAQLKQTQQSLNDERQAKIQLLSTTQGRESNYQKLLSSAQGEEQKVNQEIFNLDQQIQGKKGFKAITPVHGILAYPIDAVLTQGYGNTGFTKLGYTFHNGIDLAAPAGTPISAAADGVVYAVGRGEAAFGNWVVIKHTITAAGGHQIMTLYGHMSSFVVSAGQSVRQGDLIGYEGNTGNTTRLIYGPEHGFHLHFGVYDAESFGIADGAYPKIYGPYQVPYGYTYNPLGFLSPQ